MRSIEALINELKKAKKELSGPSEPHKDDPEHEKKEKEKALKIKKEAEAILDMHKSDLKETFPFGIGALHADKKLDSPEIARHHIKLHEKFAQQATNDSSRKYHRDQASQIGDHITGKKKYDPEAERIVIPPTSNPFEKAKVDDGASIQEKMKIRRARAATRRDPMVSSEREASAKISPSEVKPRKPKSGEKPDFVSESGKHQVVSSGVSREGLEARELMKPKKKRFFKGEDMKKADFISPEHQKANKAKSIAERNAAAKKEAKIVEPQKAPVEKPAEQPAKPSHLRIVKAQEVFDTLVKNGQTESALLLRNWGEEDSVAKACRELLEKSASVKNRYQHGSIVEFTGATGTKTEPHEYSATETTPSGETIHHSKVPTHENDAKTAAATHTPVRMIPRTEEHRKQNPDNPSNSMIDPQSNQPIHPTKVRMKDTVLPEHNSQTKFKVQHVAIHGKSSKEERLHPEGEPHTYAANHPSRQGKKD